MSDTQRSSVIFNSREQLLSGDLNRLQKLVSRDAQNVLLEGAARDSFTDGWGNPFDAVYTGSPGDGNAPIARGSLGGIGISTGSYTFFVGAGQADFQVATSDPDSSSWQICRWPNTWLTINPDGSNPRIDLVIATPVNLESDLESRNILLNPSSRAMAPQNVFKTQDPTATISVVAGTAGSNLAPTCPAGSLPLWEVVSQPSDTDATTYRFLRRVWRRVESFGTCHGVLEGCMPTQNGIADEGIDLQPYLPGSTVHRAIIDGEVVVFPALSGQLLWAQQDSKNAPLAGSPGTFDTPCYFYVVGGRNAPRQGLPVSYTDHGLPAPVYSPLLLVASLTTPTYGRASNDLAYAGVTFARAGTLYVGIGFVGSGGGVYKATRISGDWVYPLTSQYSLGGDVQPLGPWPQFTEAVISPPGATGTTSIHTPATSTECDLSLNLIETGVDSAFSELFFGSGSADGNMALMAATALAAGAGVIPGRARIALPNAGYGSFNYTASGNLSAAQMVVSATGYNMNVRRYAL